MSSVVCHLKQARHNEQLAKKLIGSVYKDWVVIALFYAAVHYLEASWANQGWHSDNHDERDDYIKRSYRREIVLRTFYKSLFQNAWLARYLDSDLNNLSIAHEYFNEDDIKTFVDQLNTIKKTLKVE